jgi:hypothetical protein
MKTTVGKSCGPASPTKATERLLVLEGRGDKALLLARLDISGWLISDGQRWVKQRSARSRAARSTAERWEGKSEVGDDFLGDVWSSDKGGGATHVVVDDRWPPAPSALRVVRTATGNRGGVRDRATVPSVQTETGRWYVGPAR